MRLPLSWTKQRRLSMSSIPISEIVAKAPCPTHNVKEGIDCPTILGACHDRCVFALQWLQIHKVKNGN